MLSMCIGYISGYTGFRIMKSLRNKDYVDCIATFLSGVICLFITCKLMML